MFRKTSTPKEPQTDLLNNPSHFMRATHRTVYMGRDRKYIEFFLPGCVKGGPIQPGVLGVLC